MYRLNKQIRIIKIIIRICKIVRIQHLIRYLLILLLAQVRRVIRLFFTIKNSISIPAGIFIYITQKCNLNCKGCIAKGYTDVSLDINLLEKRLCEAEKYGVNSYSFLGGEPMLPHSFNYILNKAKSNPFLNINIVTNGTLINGICIQQLMNHPNILLFISLDGFKMHHESRRGSYSYTKLMQSLKRMQKCKIPYVVMTTVTGKNYDEVLSSAFINQVFLLGACTLAYLPYMPTSEENDYLKLSEFQLSQLPLLIKQLSKQYPYYYIVDALSSETQFAGCRAATKSLTISADGSIQPCPALMLSTDSIERSLVSALKSPLFKFINQLKKECPNECLYLKKRDAITAFMELHSSEIKITSPYLSTILQNGFCGKK